MPSHINILKESLLCSLFCVLSLMVCGQELRWLDPVNEKALSGRVPQVNLGDGYARLPLAMKEQVRDPVWRLGTDAAGVYIDFSTDSENIQVQYGLSKGLNMAHMPSTGVSGLDLYTKDLSSGQWNWIHGGHKFTDTVRYTFSDFEEAGMNRKYRLYLPLYNAVEWMEIGIDNESHIDFHTPESKPIVVYGTSIAQGACASRPGLAWTNWLGRSSDKEIINLGFSGNGRLEPEILDLIKEIDASVFILDCIPNIPVDGERGEDGLAHLMENAVRMLRDKHPRTPIVFAAHSSSNIDGILNVKTNADYDRRSQIGEEVVRALIDRGDANLFWLSTDELGMDIDSTVDYAHPNDLGMQKIASAYERLLDRIHKTRP